MTLLLFNKFLLIFLSTYNSIELNSTKEKKKNFLTIQEIEIINNFFIQDHEIEAKLKKIYNKNIFLIKREDIEKPLKEIDFFEKVEVKKKYPNTIEVKIFETEPIAILYKNKTKYLLDDLSNLILIRINQSIRVLQHTEPSSYFQWNFFVISDSSAYFRN